MNRCPKVAVAPCSFIDDSLLDILCLDDHKALSSCLKKSTDLVSARDGKGQTLLHIAAARNRYHCVETLLQFGADGFAVEDESGWTPLHAALYRGSLLAAKLLLLHQKSVPLSVLDNEGNAPFDIVVPLSQQPDSDVTDTRHVLISFGYVKNLQLGVVSDSLSRSRPKSLDGLLNEDIIQFDVCEIGGAAVSASGSAFSWGVNKNGRLGVGDDASRVRPHPVPLPLSSDKRCLAVAVSLTHSVFLLSNGEVYTCGKGYLGHDTSVKGLQQSSVPRRVEKGLKRINIVSVSCSKFRTCLVTESGEAMLLGYHMADEGIDYTPTKIEGLSQIHVVRMLTTNGHWIALSSDGDLFEQTRRERRFFRVPISRISKKDTSRPGVVQLSTCKTHSVAVTSDGTLWAWPSRAVKGSMPDTSSRPVQPRQVKAVRNVVVISASTSVDHSAVITSGGDLIEWEHEAPSFDSTGQRFPSDWLAARNEKATKLPHPRQLHQVICAPGCTLVSQELRFLSRVSAQNDSAKARVPKLLQMCENAFCAAIDERRVISAFRFAFNIHLPILLDYCTNFIIKNAQVLLFSALRELEFPELDYIQTRYQSCLPTFISSFSKNEKPPTPDVADEDLEWFVPHTVRHLRVKIRSSLKKLSQISILTERLANGETLNSEQIQKVKQKDRLRLFLQQCQGELASKLEPDPVIEFVRPTAADSSQSEEIVTIVRTQSRHSADIWQEALRETHVDSLFMPTSNLPGNVKQSKQKPSPKPMVSIEQPLLPTNMPTASSHSWSAVSSPGPASNPGISEEPAIKSSLSYALRHSSGTEGIPFQQKTRRAPRKSATDRSDSFSGYGNIENTGNRKPVPPHSTERNSASVSLADFWSSSCSSPINIKSRSKTHSTSNKQGMSPASTGSPWNLSSILRTKPFAEIQNEDVARNKALSVKGVKESRPPWASSSPPVSSFAGIVQEEMAMRLQFPDLPSTQPRSCWGPQAIPVKPNSIENIQSMQFIQEELDREAQEHARAMQAFNQNQRGGSRYRRKPSHSQQQCRRNAAATESRPRGGFSRPTTRSQ